MLEYFKSIKKEDLIFSAKVNWVINSMTLQEVKSISFFYNFDGVPFVILSPTLFWFVFDNTQAIVVTCGILSQPIFYSEKVSVTRKIKNKSGYWREYRNITRNLSCFKDPNSFSLRTVLIVHWFRSFLKLITRYTNSYPETPYTSLNSLYVKFLKLSLCREFSHQTSQEMPEGKYYIRIFPRTFSFIFPDFSSKIRFYFSLIQSKGICAPVNEHTKNIQLMKHKDSLCRDEKLITQPPQDFLDLCERLGEEFGSRLDYNPHKTCIAPTTATVTHSRSCGGAFQELKERKVITKKLPGNGVRSEPLVIGLFGPPGSGKTTIVNQIVTEISKTLGVSGDSYQDLCYSRSPFSEHWDGYTQQPIVIMDDFGQDTSKGLDIAQFVLAVSTNTFIVPMAALPDKGTEFTSPFIILTSNLTFGEVMSLSPPSFPLLDNGSLWRRIHLPYSICTVERYEEVACDYSYYKEQFLELPDNISSLEEEFEQKYSKSIQYKLRSKNKPRKTYEELQTFRTIRKIVPEYASYRSKCDGFHHLEPRLRCSTQYQDSTFRRSSIDYILKPSSLKLLIEEIRVEISSRSEFYWESIGVWPQMIHQGEFECVGEREDVDIRFNPYSNKNKNCYYFPSRPTEIKKCKVVALPEPLKVRVITAGSALSRCLKPLQEALLQSLQKDPTFTLTGNQLEEDGEVKQNLDCIQSLLRSLPKPRRLDYYEMCSKKDPSDWRYLSGDYESATDNLPMSVTKAIMKGILKHITHVPTHHWVSWELSPSILKYPFGEFKQTSGQLMGSILSFPLLCLANKALCIWSGFQEGHYFINGDDLVATVTKEQELRWKNNGPLIGLSPTVGKSFSSKDFCTVNSQLYVDLTQCPDYDNGPHATPLHEGLLHTGKLTLFKREDRTLGTTFSDAQRLYGDSVHLRHLFIHLSYVSLVKSPRSCSVPVSHGGLAYSFSGQFDQLHCKKVYFCDLIGRLFKKFETIPGLDDVFLIPFFVYLPSHLSDGCKKAFKRNFLDNYEEILSHCRQIRQSDQLPHNVQQEELSRKDLQEFEKHAYESRNLRNLLKNESLSLYSYPPLSDFEIHYYPYKGSKDLEKRRFDYIEQFVDFFKKSCMEGGKSHWNYLDPFSDFKNQSEELGDMIFDNKESPIYCGSKLDTDYSPIPYHLPFSDYFLNPPMRIHPEDLFPNHPDKPYFKYWPMCDWSFWDLKDSEIFSGDEANW